MLSLTRIVFSAWIEGFGAKHGLYRGMSYQELSSISIFFKILDSFFRSTTITVLKVFMVTSPRSHPPLTANPVALVT